MPDFKADTVLPDAAHDAPAIYNLLGKEGAKAVIDLNTGHATTLEQKGCTIGPDGVPVCSAGHKRKPAGFDKAQHRLKYRCSQMCRRNGEMVCQCQTPCSKAKYGRQVPVYPESNPRLFCDPPRGSRQCTKSVPGLNAPTSGSKRTANTKTASTVLQGNGTAVFFFIMMLMHLDAWLLSEAAAKEADRLSEAA